MMAAVRVATVEDFAEPPPPQCDAWRAKSYMSILGPDPCERWLEPNHDKKNAKTS